jgi:hypothetical protein
VWFGFPGKTRTCDRAFIRQCLILLAIETLANLPQAENQVKDWRVSNVVSEGSGGPLYLKMPLPEYPATDTLQRSFL